MSCSLGEQARFHLCKSSSGDTLERWAEDAIHDAQQAISLFDTAAAKAEAQVLISEIHMEVEAYDRSVAAAEMARMYDGSDPYALAVSKALSAQKADSCRY